MERDTLDGSQVRQAITELGTTQRGLADALGVDETTVRKWVTADGRVTGPPARLIQLLVKHIWLRHELGLKPRPARGRPPKEPQQPIDS